MVAEQIDVFGAMMQRRLEKRGEIDLADLALIFSTDERLEIEKPIERGAGVRAPPHRVELPVIGAIDVQFGFEQIRASRGPVAAKVHAFPLAAADERADVGVASALNGEVTDVLDVPRIACGF